MNNAHTHFGKLINEKKKMRQKYCNLDEFTLLAFNLKILDVRKFKI